MRATDAAGNLSGYSNVATATTLPTIPGSPQYITILDTKSQWGAQIAFNYQNSASGGATSLPSGRSLTSSRLAGSLVAGSMSLTGSFCCSSGS